MSAQGNSARAREATFDRLGAMVRAAETGEVSERVSLAGRPGGLWAASLHAAGHTCDRVPLAIDFGRCVDAKWCHTGCIFGAKNTVNTNYLAAAEAAGVRVRPDRQVDSITRSSTDGYRYVVTADVMDNEGDNPSRAPVYGQSEQIECKVLVMSAGAMGTPPILLRSKNNRTATCRRCPTRPASTWASTAITWRVSSTTRRRSVSS